MSEEGPAPQAEAARLAAIATLDLDELKPTFERIGRLARAFSAMELGDVVLVGAQRTWHASIGPDWNDEQVSEDQSFSQVAVECDEVLWVADARDDPRFSAHPHVNGPEGVRFYAGVPIRMDEGSPIGVVCVAHHEPRAFDPTLAAYLTDLAAIAANECSRHHAQRDLVKAAGDAEAANKAKSEFLANMSHEIRTPLNGVMGIAGALARTELSPNQAEMVELIETSAQTLEALLTDILDLARIEAGRMEIRPEPFDLTTSVNACAALFEASAQAKDIDLRVELEPYAQGMFEGDAPRIRQILSNLLGNAVKFTSGGEVKLTVRARRDETTTHLTFSVSDTGIGFDEATRQRLFGRFQQADGSITRKYGGTGLGLAISRNLAEAMGGELTADATPGRGATFYFSLELPRRQGTVEMWGEHETHHTEEAELDTMRVLLAEDHPTNRRVVELILGAAGVDLFSVENGAEAVDEAARSRFDLILMDMQMPVMDGLTAIKAIRRREERNNEPRTPIYTLTANAMPEHALASAAAGADGHVTKPITAERLLHVVEQVWTDKQNGATGSPVALSA
ncbi:GAF domain-containing hybrid sensor histidine kinase/response regulator [Phenylobacterium sp.]|uniref:GAF domain-containing hybrid sensor histidine kinase/response regulator n=1 Tax=Phenylobacterium sp. TaxID=1871053 RepID=UPI00273484EC|nr:GAF domain-containing hybrid sensor histidine kinase/response regulator [Phenylobacterium sp.]MDP3855021.1 ATP-binding protein [Phenylobacterium sp.]